jgi:hypothetical protein
MEAVWVEGTLRLAETTRPMERYRFSTDGTSSSPIRRKMTAGRYALAVICCVVCGVGLSWAVADDEEATSTRSAPTQYCGGEHRHQ